MADKPKVLQVVDDIINHGDFTTENFGREFIPDRDEHGNIVTLRNGEHFDVKRKGVRRTKLVELPSEVGEHVKTPDSIPNPPGRVMRVTKRKETHNWSEVRKYFVLGKRVQLEDGSWVSEDYSLKELSLKFGVNYEYLRKKSSNESWGKIRKAYLARVNQINIGQELGLYTQENYQAEIAAMNACNKLGIVLDKYIDHKFGDILDNNEDVDCDGSEVGESIEEHMRMVNRASGAPVLMTELKEAIKVASDIYSLQRKVYDNAPKTEMEIIEKMTNKPKFKNEKERTAKIQQLQAKLSGVLKPNEVIETVSSDSIVDME